MTMRSAGQPDEATRRAARKLAMLAGACLVPALVAQALFLPGGNREIAIPITAAIGLALLASLWTVQAEGPWRVLVDPTVIVLDAGSVIAGALLPIGADGPWCCYSSARSSWSECSTVGG